MWMAKIWDKCLRVHGCGHVKLGMRAWEARWWGLVQLMPTIDALMAEGTRVSENGLGKEGGDAQAQIWQKKFSRQGSVHLKISLKNI